MTEDQLNILSYDFVRKIQELKTEEKQNEEVSSLDNLPLIDITDVIIDGPLIKRTLNPNLSRYKITISDNGIDYGFEDTFYPKFFQLIDDIHELEYFKQTVSLEFIEENTIKWILKVYKLGKSENELINKLKDESQNVIEKRNYYFHVINLFIDEPFKIGNVELTFFTKEYFDKYWNAFQKKDEINQKEFDDIFRKYQGRVFAKFEVNAESKMGKEIAFNECCLAIDALRCFTMTTAIPDRKCYMDLSDRININFQTDNFSIPEGKEFSFRISSSARNDPFKITKEFYKHLLKTGLEVFSDLIKSKNNNEVTNLLVQAIKLYSYAISTFDLHLRVTQLVTIFESLLLEEDRTYKMEVFVKKRVCKLFHPNDKINQELLLSEMYQIRHKMIHKAKRLPINMTKLRDFQISLIETIKRISYLNKTIKNKEQLIAHLTD